MRASLFFCALAAAAFLLFFAPMSSAAEDPTPSPPSGIAVAQALIQSGMLDEALTVLRLLVQDNPDDADVLFLIGLTAIESAQQPDIDEAIRDALLDEAIAYLRIVLITRPELVRVRLELARAFFLKGEDSLSRFHFELVLAGNPAPPVRANIQRFLATIRARRRWSMYAGASLAPDSNILGSSDTEIIEINGLPFRRDEESLVTSGIGISAWAGGEYQHPLAERLRLRVGADVAVQQFEGSEFDQLFLAGRAGPRWLVSENTDVSVLADTRIRWFGNEPYYGDLGGRLEVFHRLNGQLALNARMAWHKGEYETQAFRDGTVSDFLLSGFWTVTPILRASATLGYSIDNAESDQWRNKSSLVQTDLSIILPLGFNLGVGGGLRWTTYEGNWAPFTPGGVPRKDTTKSVRASIYNRAFTVYGFSPQLTVSYQVRDTNAQAYDYNRIRSELRFVRQF